MFLKEKSHSISSTESVTNTALVPGIDPQDDPAALSALDTQHTAVAVIPAAPEQQEAMVVSTSQPQQPQQPPILIPSTGKKSTGTMRAPKGRRLVINIGAAVALLVILVGVLAAVLPTQNGNANGLLGLIQPKTKSVSIRDNQTTLIAAQAATATAVMQDGYDAGGNVTYAGVNRDYTLSNGQSTLDIATGGSQSASTTAAAGGQVSAANLVIHATPGQCTYWAQYRYWQLTGYEVPWSGNASTYAYQAPLYGWINSYTPVLHSIIVLQPGVQHAGATTGHVGIVEGINSDGSLNVSSWNIVAPGVLSYNTYYAGPGVSFVYHP